MVAAMRILLGGGTQASLSRIIGKCDGLGVALSYATSEEEAGAWKRKAKGADVAIIRTGRVSHRAWLQVKAWVPLVVMVNECGEEALIAAVVRAAQQRSQA